MSEEQKPTPPPQKNGPCFFGEEHIFQTVYARDPFTGETFTETRCSSCGTAG